MVRTATNEDLAWLEQHACVALTRRAFGVAAVDKSCAVRGVVAFDNCTPGSAHVHVAVDTPMAWRRLLAPAAAAGFGEKRDVLIGVIRESNRPSLNHAFRAGFRPIHKLACGWAKDEALMVLELRRADCRFLPR